jgi:aspartyl-tRNA(Asn)/glutamyl-tRNA(Gln) amidotransferase subunit A
LSLLDLSIPEAGARLRDGTLTSAALTQAHLDRIALIEPTIHAFVEVTKEWALAAAARADDALARGDDYGPLHGIPIALKDLIDVQGVATTCGSHLRASHVPAEDSDVARGLVQAGAVLLGKLATYEFALVGPSFDQPTPPAANPWNLDHITGGSSSGSAAAVAAGMVRSAVGTDTGGSIRSPACYCGVVGLKPTFGRVSSRGVFPLSPSLDHVGPISASVAEAALTLDAITGYDHRDPAGSRQVPPPAAGRLGQGIEGLRIAYARDWFAQDPALMPEVLSAMDDAVSQLSLLGARIEEVSLPNYDLLEAAGAVILHAESLEIHRATMAARSTEYGRQAYQRLAAGICLSESDLARAQQVGQALCNVIDTDIFTRHDALVTANTLATAPPLSDFQGKGPKWTAMRTLPFNVTGHPALALPVGFAAGLPIGMQIVGRAFDEAQVCRIGAAFERSTDHSAQRPPPIPRLHDAA